MKRGLWAFVTVMSILIAAYPKASDGIAVFHALLATYALWRMVECPDNLHRRALGEK